MPATRPFRPGQRVKWSAEALAPNSPALRAKRKPHRGTVQTMRRYDLDPQKWVRVLWDHDARNKSAIVGVKFLEPAED